MPMSLLNFFTPWSITIFLCLPHSILLETNCLLSIFSALLIITNPVKSVSLLLRSTVSKLVFYKTLNLDPSALFVTFNSSHVLFANTFVCNLTSVIGAAFPLLSPDFLLVLLLSFFTTIHCPNESTKSALNNHSLSLFPYEHHQLHALLLIYPCVLPPDALHEDNYLFYGYIGHITNKLDEDLHKLFA